MSLLLDALKKAEKAKEQAQRQAEAAQTAATAAPGAGLGTNPSPSALELELEPAPPPPAPEGGAGPPETARPDTESHARAEDFFGQSNPRRPFHASLGVLGVIAAFTIGYFWVQIRPLPALLNATSAGAAAGPLVEAAAPAGAPDARMRTQADRAQGAEIPGLPQTAIAIRDNVSSEPAASAIPRNPPTSSEAPVEPRQPKKPAPAASTATAVAAPAPTASHRESRGALSTDRITRQVDPRVVAGYASYQAGNLAEAHREYEEALREDPANRDALLGLAAVEMRAQRYDRAEAYYERLLQADPRDPHAHAGMLALRGQHMDPVRAASRVKSLLANDPAANVLYFTLGNQYAQQGLWAEAQQAYFRAYASDSENPDFAFNLAVSLDRLGQSAPALEYYRRALALAERRAAGFSPEMARRRERQLSR